MYPFFYLAVPISFIGLIVENIIGFISYTNVNYAKLENPFYVLYLGISKIII